LDKKAAHLPPVCLILLAPDPEDPTSATLKPDEFPSCVLEKAHDSCTRTLSQPSCLWRVLLDSGREDVCLSLSYCSSEEVSRFLTLIQA
jgi:hypothetical protein